MASVSLSSIPYGADETVFVVIENSGGRGSVDRETERGDLETVVADLLAGQIGDPIRVLAFNTLEHWSKEKRKGLDSYAAGSWGPAAGAALLSANNHTWREP